MLIYQLSEEKNLVQLEDEKLTKKINKIVDENHKKITQINKALKTLGIEPVELDNNTQKNLENKTESFAILVKEKSGIGFKVNENFHAQNLFPIKHKTGLFVEKEVYFCHNNEPIYFEEKGGVSKFVFNGKSLEQIKLTIQEYHGELHKIQTMAEQVRQESIRIKKENFIKKHNLDADKYFIYQWSQGNCADAQSVGIIKGLYPEMKEVLPSSVDQLPKVEVIQNLITLFDAVPQAKEKFLIMKSKSLYQEQWEQVITNFSKIEKVFKADTAIFGSDLGNASYEIIAEINKSAKYNKKPNKINRI